MSCSSHRPSSPLLSFIIIVNNSSSRTPSPFPIEDHENLCGTCLKEVHDQDPAILCEHCGKWIHTKCDKITKKQYSEYQNDENKMYECRNCRKCAVCEKTKPINQHPLECVLCYKRVHTKCNKFDKKDYDYFQKDETPDFYCIKCLQALPLQNLDNNHFDLAIKAIDCPDEFNANDIQLSQSQKEMIKKINQAISTGLCNDDDDDDINPVDCKYYTIDEHNNKKFNSIKHFSLLHLNIHSLEFHIEELRTALKLVNIKFDFICITETKINKNKEPISDLNIEGYQDPVGMPTEAQKGGVCIYSKIGIDWKPRNDLNMHKSKELESYFIEAINGNGKNAIIGSIYRHPRMSKDSFIEDYMEPLNDKLSKENKKIFLAGDFNFDLLSTVNDKEKLPIL